MEPYCRFEPKRTSVSADRRACAARRQSVCRHQKYRFKSPSQRSGELNRYFFARRGWNRTAGSSRERSEPLVSADRRACAARRQSVCRHQKYRFKSPSQRSGELNRYFFCPVRMEPYCRFEPKRTSVSADRRACAARRQSVCRHKEYYPQDRIHLFGLYTSCAGRVVVEYSLATKRQPGRLGEREYA